MMFIEDGDPNVGVIGQFESALYASIEQPFRAELVKVLDFSVCQGSWSGTLTQTNPTSTVKSVSFDVTSSGAIINCVGLAPPVAGNMYALPDGTLVGFMTTGETDEFNQIWLDGDLSGNTASGIMYLDITDGVGTFSLSR